MFKVAVNKKIHTLFVVLILAIFGQDFAGADELFPTGPELQNRIDFWIKAFTQYSKEEIILHDNDHMEIVYDVVNLRDGYGEGLTGRSRWRLVEKSKQEIRTILAQFARMNQPIDLALLSDRERYVHNLWAHVQDANKFARARDNIHAQSGLNALFRTGLERSGKYLERMQSIFREYDLPEDLCYLPHVESAFNYRAYSKAGAAGIWQFTRSTGRLYMSINYSVDERYDPILATHSAARLMRSNFTELGSWPLALTAYNHGTNGMKRAKNQLKTSDLEIIISRYNGRAFGFASKNFYAEFMAAREVAKNYQRYFGNIEFEQPIEYQEFTVPHYVTIDALAKKFGLEKQVLVQFNPALRPPIVRSLRRVPKGYPLRLPVMENLDPQALYAAVPEGEKYEQQVIERYYRVEPGDNLGSIARRFRTSVDALMAINGIANPRRLQIGQLLEMPNFADSEQNASPQPALQPETAQMAQATPPAADMLPLQPAAIEVAQSSPAERQELADSMATEPMDILAQARYQAQANGGMENTVYGPEPPANFVASRSDSLSPSTWTFAVNFDEPENDLIIIQPEETIGHIAEWLGTSAQRLRELNHLSANQNIQVGRKLRVSFARTSQNDFHRQRLEYHRALQEDFFSSYKVNSTVKYTVKSGDNIWQLCNRTFDIPFWLVSRYNKNINLIMLKPGDLVDFPVVSPLLEAVQESPEAE